MSSLSTRPRGRALATAAAVGVLLVAWSPVAAAAPGVVVPLDPPEISVLLLPTENLPDPNLSPDDPAYVDFAAVEIQWGGSVVLQLPAEFDATAASFELALGDEDDEEPTRTYSTELPAPDELVVAPLGGGQYEVTMPLDDGVNGPLGVLTVDGVLPVDGDGIETLPLSYLLEFDPAFGATQNLLPQFLAMATAPCAITSPDPCDPYAVRPGEQIELNVPVGSRLRALGLGTLTDAEATLVSEDTSYVDEETGVVSGDLMALAAAGAESPQLATALLAAQEMSASGAAGVLASAVTSEAIEQEPGVLDLALTPIEPYRAALSVPADAPAGVHALFVIEGNLLSGNVSMTMIMLEILAVPEIPAPNAGLHSETGWEDPAVGGTGTSGSTGLVLLGGGMLLAAAGAAAAVLRPRRDRAAETCSG